MLPGENGNVPTYHMYHSSIVKRIVQYSSRNKPASLLVPSLLKKEGKKGEDSANGLFLTKCQSFGHNFKIFNIVHNSFFTHTVNSNPLEISRHIGEEAQNMDNTQYDCEENNKELILVVLDKEPGDASRQSGEKKARARAGDANRNSINSIALV